MSLRTIPVWVMAKGLRMMVNAALDDGSNDSFVSEHVIQHLGIRPKMEQVPVNTLNGHVSPMASAVVSIVVASVDGSLTHKMDAQTCPNTVLGNYTPVN